MFAGVVEKLEKKKLKSMKPNFKYISKELVDSCEKSLLNMARLLLSEQQK